MSLSNLFEPNDFNIYTKTIDGDGELDIGKADATTALHLGNTSTPVYINELLYNGTSTPLSIGAIGTVPNPNGMTLASSVLNLQPANGTYGGIVSTGTQAFMGQKFFNSGIALQNFTSGYVAHTLDYYEEASVVNTTATGPWTSLSWTLTFTRIGKMVTMQFSALNSAVTVGGNPITTGAVIPTRFLPAQTNVSQIEIINGVNNASYGGGMLQINAGTILIATSTRASFSSTYAGVSAGSISYLTA